MNTPIETKQLISNFLDAVDTVLNSNTFLFELPLNSSLEPNIWLLKLGTYLRSKEFNDAIFNQDATRKWYNYYTLTENDFIRYPASFLKENFPLDVTPYSKNPIEYLEAMLPGNRSVFFQPLPPRNPSISCTKFGIFFPWSIVWKTRLVTMDNQTKFFV